MAGSRQVDTVDQVYRQPPHVQTYCRADAHLEEKELQQPDAEEHIVDQHLQQPDGEKNRHWGVRGALDLRHRLEALRISANTAAASVEPTMAPINNPSSSGRSKIQPAARPVMRAVTSTPRVASNADGFHTVLIAAKGVCKPPP